LKSIQVIFGLLGFLVISACGSTPGAYSAPEPVAEVESSYKSRLTSAGLVPLTGTEIDTLLRGNNFQSEDGSWTWDFAADGLASSAAPDGSWDQNDQRWEVQQDKLCRSVNETFPCVSIYQADGVIRFAKEGTDELETWAIVAR